jgi:hypothetical protein
MLKNEFAYNMQTEAVKQLALREHKWLKPRATALSQVTSLLYISNRTIALMVWPTYFTVSRFARIVASNSGKNRLVF